MNLEALINTTNSYSRSWFNHKGRVTHMHTLAINTNKEFSFAHNSTIENSDDLCFHWLYVIQCLISLPLLITIIFVHRNICFSSQYFSINQPFSIFNDPIQIANFHTAVPSSNAHVVTPLGFPSFWSNDCSLVPYLTF